MVLATLLLSWAATGHTQSVSPLQVPSASERFDTAFDRACARVGIRPSEVRLREDYLPIDPFRLAVFNRWISEPLRLPAEMSRAASEVQSDSWHRRLSQLFDWRDIENVHKEANLDQPRFRQTLSRLWEDNGGKVPSKYRRKISELEHQLPEEIQRRLSNMLDLHFVVSAAEIRPLRSLSSEEQQTLRDLVFRLFTGDIEDYQELQEYEIEELLDVTQALPGKEFLREIRSASPLLERLLSNHPPSEDSFSSLPGILVDWKTPQGRLIIGGSDRQVYQLRANENLFILDLGGDDIYQGPFESMMPGLFGYIIDLGGNDTYEARAPLGFGAALGAVSLLYDLSGSDRYLGHALNFGVGLLGVGLLVDAQGKDFYECATGAMGVGYAGIGLLVDQSGNDQYIGHSGVQGVGAPAGVGVLLDRNGDDLYVAGNANPDKVARRPLGYINFSQGFGFGLRPYCSGGIGLLLDEKGNDRYLSSYFAQGSSYWVAIGALVDRQGDDLYDTLRYSQGAGIHWSLGLLLDEGGHDVYNAWGVSQGCGHDIAAGFLWDSTGNDLYRGSWLYGGAGNANGYGFLVDAEGDDHYVPSSLEPMSDSQALGWGQYMRDRDMDSLGFLLDLAGEDYFAGQPVEMFRRSGDVGILVDLPDDLE